MIICVTVDRLSFFVQDTLTMRLSAGKTNIIRVILD